MGLQQEKLSHIACIMIIIELTLSVIQSWMVENEDSKFFSMSIIWGRAGNDVVAIATLIGFSFLLFFSTLSMV